MIALLGSPASEMPIDAAIHPIMTYNAYVDYDSHTQNFPSNDKAITLLPTVGIDYRPAYLCVCVYISPFRTCIPTLLCTTRN